MRKLLLFVSLVCVFGLMNSQEIQVAPSDDMYADCVVNGPAHNEGDLFLVYESSAEQEQIMIKFDLSGVQGIEFEAATLNLHRYFSCGSGGGTTTAMIYLITEDWDEETWDEHTYVSFDEPSGFAYAFSGPSMAQDTWFEVDIMDYFELWMYGNQPNFGLVIIADEGQRHSKFNSKEAANPDFAPFLNLTLATDAEDVITQPQISLSNYPNPFNPTTVISYNIEVANDNIDLIIYNSTGQKVKTFTDIITSNSLTNQLVWDGRDDANNPVTSGVYFYKLDLEGSPTKKMILMK